MLNEFDGKLALDNITARYAFPVRYFDDFIISAFEVSEKTFSLNNIPDLEFPISLKKMLFKE